jgi:hypothetical protein
MSDLQKAEVISVTPQLDRHVHDVEFWRGRNRVHCPPPRVSGIGSSGSGEITGAMGGCGNCAHAASQRLRGGASVGSGMELVGPLFLPPPARNWLGGGN